jgi:hypothetical protein
MSNSGEYELTYRTADGRLVTGWYTLHDGMITVRRWDGRTKTTQIGGSPGHAEGLAIAILCEPNDWR